MIAIANEYSMRRIAEIFLGLLPVFIFLLIILGISFLADWMYYKLFKKRLIKPWISHRRMGDKF
jgi:hypothetical protein